MDRKVQNAKPMILTVVAGSELWKTLQKIRMYANYGIGIVRAVQQVVEDLIQNRSSKIPQLSKLCN